jgi:Domain of unknown function (DUF4262)
MDAAEEEALANIKRVGCHVIHVFAEDDLPAFSYSVGIQRSAGAPEVIVIGLKHEVAHIVVNEYNNRVQDGERFTTGELYAGFLENFEVTFERVDRRHYQEHLGWDLWLYGGDDFEVLQLIYPTRSGVWPWDPEGPRLFGSLQPILTASGGREGG